MLDEKRIRELRDLAKTNRDMARDEGNHVKAESWNFRYWALMEVLEES